MLANRFKSENKEIYRTFIDKVTFDKLNKGNIQLYLKFDEKIID
ncbi:hypothetical protein [Enterococcus lactis]|nr:hypothetical protein [Enterococcus lactis]